MAQQSGSAMTGKPLIEGDRVEGTTVYDPAGNNIGSIKRLMIEKISGRVAYAVMSFGGFLGMGTGACGALEQADLRYEFRRVPDGYHRAAVARRASFLAR
jgi:hypothetical protein